MKKLTSLLIIALFFNLSYSQDILLYEDFSSELVPAAGWTVNGGGSSNWQLYQSNDASGEIPEMYFCGWESFNGNSKMTSPVINTTGYSGLVIEWKHKILNGSNPTVTLKVETTSDGITWNEIWSSSSTGFIGPETLTIPVTNSDVGSSTFQFALTFDGDTDPPTGYMNSWRIDDIKLSELLSNDVAPAELFLTEEIPSGSVFMPFALIQNLADDVVSFDVTLNILEGTTSIYSSTKSLTNLGSVESEFIYFDEYTAATGNYSAVIYTSLAGDTDTDNDTITMEVSVHEDVFWKTPLYEMFTGSHCHPCVEVNEVFFDLFNDNPNEYTLIKYQMFEGQDPYHIQDGEDRRTYYDVGGIPDDYVNGILFPGAHLYSQYDFDIESMSVSKLSIIVDEANTYIDESGIVHLDASIEAFDDYAAGLKQHIAVVERTTTGNTGTNGETEFHNVLMSMVPNADGTTLGSFTYGEQVDINETVDMTTTFMEENTDLALIIFIQDDNDKTVLQSVMIDIPLVTEVVLNEADNIKIYPIPAIDHIIIEKAADSEATILDITGKVLKQVSINNYAQTVDLQSFAEGMYVIKIQNSKGVHTQQFVIRNR